MGFKTNILCAAGGLAAIVGAYSWIGSSNDRPIEKIVAGFDQAAITRNIPSGKKLVIEEGAVDPVKIKLQLEKVVNDNGDIEGKTYLMYGDIKIPLYEEDLTLLEKIGIKQYIRLREKQYREVVKEDPDFDPDYRNWSRR